MPGEGGSKVRLLYVADGRSQTAQSWIGYFIDQGHEVHLATSFDCDPPLDLASLTHIPVALSGLSGRGNTQRIEAGLNGVGSIQLRTSIRHWIGPYTVPSAARRLEKLEEKLKPDLVHAMRIPFEGMLAAGARLSAPLIVSVWGNDFTLHGTATHKMKVLTERTLQKTTGLHVDCNRDLRLAHEWGFGAQCAAIVLPGSGGVKPEIFHTTKEESNSQAITIQGSKLEIPNDSVVVLNPRGFRAYVRQDTFFKSIPLILKQDPRVVFLCPAMEGNREARDWMNALEIGQSVHLLPKLTPSEMGEVMRRSSIVVSPSEHDGTPNTLLESMACGCFPIWGNLESIKEWIEDEVNGLLIDPSDPNGLADALARAVNDEQLLLQARQTNIELISQRAIREEVMQKAEKFYGEVI